MRYNTWKEQRESYQGWCTTCLNWTREGTEPDAVDYDCPCCDENTVVGAETALELGHIDVEDF